jgi:hypothetical protein
MNGRPQEETQVHTRLLKCALEVEDARAYWAHTDGSIVATAQQAFDEYWFGARSLAWIRVLLINMRARYDTFPPSLAVLHGWPEMAPDTRRLICHWHMQLSDPLYRRFAGEFLVDRRQGPRAEVTRDLVVRWVGEQGPGRWTMATRIQFASKLLSAAHTAGLVATNRDPRPLVLPRVTDEALEYCLYLLRGADFAGSLLENPYLASVGLQGGVLEDRLRGLPGLRFARQAALVDFGWHYPDLTTWSAAKLLSKTPAIEGAVA